MNSVKDRLVALASEAAALLPGLLVFLVFKAYSAAPCAGDENIYYYLGWRMASGGLAPYSDFFFAHPPLHIVIAAFWMWLHPYTPLWGKLGSIAPAFLCMILVYYALRRAGFSRLYAAVGPLLLAFSHDWLGVSSHFTGINWTTFAFVAGVMLLLDGRLILSGIALALAALIGFHIIPAVAFVCLVATVKYKLKVWKLWASCAGVTLGVHLLCIILWGEKYFGPVFRYHFNKPAMEREGASAVIRFFWNEYHLLVLALIAFFWLALTYIYKRRREKNFAFSKLHELALYCITVLAVEALALKYLSRVYTYYMQPMLPFMAIMSVVFIRQAVDMARKALADLRRSKRSLTSTAGLLALMLLVLAGFVWGEKLESRLGYYKNEYGKMYEYPWKDSPWLPGFMNSAVKKIFYSSQRRVGDWYNSITLYLWHEVRTEDPTPMTDSFKVFSEGRPGRIFGDNSSVPLIAMQTGRLITMDLDTNSMIFRSGQVPVDKLMSGLQAEPPRWVIVCPTRGIWGIPSFRNWVTENYRFSGQVKTGQNERLMLYENIELSN